MKTLRLAFVCTILFTACRKGDKIIPPVVTPVDTPSTSGSLSDGFYLLNEGNMGSNKASLDFYNAATGNYNKNIYATENPDVVKELGDVGNDIQVYGGKLYAVINVSNYVEVMDVATAKHLGTISIANCRYITFANGKAYISSYAGPVKIDPKAPIGFVAEVDTATLQITRKVTVGYQPEQLAVVNNKLYVANSGGYRVPNYDSTVSVIDLSAFTVIKTINVAINLHQLKADADGDIYVSSRGDYLNIASALFRIDTKTDEVTQKFNMSTSELFISGDTAYVYGSEYSNLTKKWAISYNMLNVRTETVLNRNFITDGTEQIIKMPYGVAVNPVTKDIMVTDAKDYISPGTVYCFDKYGKKKWSVTAGDIPAHFAFVAAH